MMYKIKFVPHRKHIVSATKTSWLKLLRERITAYCENHMKHTSVGRIQSFSKLKQVVQIVATGFWRINLPFLLFLFVL
jgi:hypothetical protein